MITPIEASSDSGYLACTGFKRAALENRCIGIAYGESHNYHCIHYYKHQYDTDVLCVSHQRTDLHLAIIHITKIGIQRRTYKAEYASEKKNRAMPSVHSFGGHSLYNDKLGVLFL